MYSFIKDAMADNADVVAFCDHEIELLNKKNSAAKKPTKTQIANESIKDEILAVLNGSDPMTATDIVAKLDGKYSVNKVSALLTQLKEDNSITREVIKRKAYFTVA